MTSLRLKRFLTFNFIFVALLPIIVFGLITLNILTENMENEIRWKNMLLARSLSSRVERLLREPLTLLQQIGEVVVSRKLIKNFEVNEYIESVMGNYGLFDSILILDDSAVVMQRAPYNSSYIGISMRGNDFVKSAMKNGRAVWSSTFVSVDTGEPTIHVIHPRHDKTIIMGNLNLGTLNNLIEEMDLGSGGRVFLLDQNGVVIAHEDETWITRRRNLNNLEVVKQGLGGREGTFPGRMFGIDSLASVAVIPHTRWLVLVVQPEKEAFAPAKRIRVLFWGGSGIALLLALVLALTSIRKTLRPLDQLLAQTRKIAQGDYLFKDQPGSFQEIDALAAGFKIMAEAVKSREAELLASEAKYRELVQNANSIILRLDPEGRITFFNEFAQQFFNITEEEVLGAHVTGTIVPPTESSGRDLRELVDDLLRHPERHPINENENIRANGERVWVSWTNKPVYDEGGRLVEILCVGIDITGRKQAEDQLREGEQKLKAIFEASPDPIVVYDKDGFLQYSNPAFTRIFGWTLEELHLRPIPYIPPDQEDISAVKIKELYETDGPVRLETRRLNKKGESLDIIISAAPITDIDGRTVGMVVNLTDITARKKLESQLQQAHKMEAVGTLAGGIAHDFNNLLQAISGYAQIVLLRRRKDDRGFRELNEIINVCDRAAQLIQQLLTFSRKVESKKRPIDANQEVMQVKELLERTLPRMIDIELHPADNLMTINADPVQVEQILMNLGSNARDAMPEGGRLIIETANAYLDREYCKYHRGAIPGDYVLISVTDTGHGMDKETLEHIFEPFFTTKELGKGTGLGLASVYGIVKNHNGYITCHSEIGRGAAFKIYFPALESFLPDITETTPPDIIEGGRETILVVDDEDWIRDLVTEALKYYGYQVLLAPSGEEAVDIYKSGTNPVDLVILDLGMPGMGGHKCMRALLKLNPAAKILVATGYSTDTDVRDTMELGAAGFLAKPCQLNDILLTVRAVLDR